MSFSKRTFSLLASLCLFAVITNAAPSGLLVAPAGSGNVATEDEQQYLDFDKKYDPSNFHMGFGKRRFDPSNFHMGFGKRRFDPSNFHMGFGRRDGFDPSNFHMGFGKRQFDPTNFHMGFGKRYDPSNFHMGFGK